MSDLLGDVGVKNATSRTVTALTGTAAQVPDPRTLPGSDSEFCRMADMRRLFGITRSTAYQLANDGLIRTVSLRKRGNARGVRLVLVPSVRAYLQTLLRRQEGGAS